MGRAREYVALWAAIVATGCADSPAEICADGRVCPPGMVCDPVHPGCVGPDQLESCVGMDDGTDCLVAGAIAGVCRDHISLLRASRT